MGSRPLEKVAFSAEGNLLTDWVLNDVVGATTWTYPRGSVTMEEYLEIVATIRVGFWYAYSE